jgi:hypothetical protein
VLSPLVLASVSAEVVELVSVPESPGVAVVALSPVLESPGIAVAAPGPVESSWPTVVESAPWVLVDSAAVVVGVVLVLSPASDAVQPRWAKTASAKIVRELERG